MAEEKVTEKVMETDKVFCMMPWVHFHVTQYGTVTPCCQTPWDNKSAFGDINKQSISEIWNGEEIKKFRKKMMNGEADVRCTRCYTKEKADLFSLRKATNNDYKKYLDRVNETLPDGTSPGTAPVYFDIRFSNHCNFKCRICGPWSSSTWFNDAKELGYDNGQLRLTKAVANMDEFLEQLKKLLPEAQEIYFAGGEPLMMEEHYVLLDTLLEMGLTKTYLRYNTNFSIFEFRGKSIFDYWKKFENIFLCASLDDNYQRGELQRKGQNWDEVVANRQRIMKECPHIDFMLAPTLSVLNVFHLPAFHREWVEKGLIDVSEIWPSLLEQPEEYNVKTLPAHLKGEIEVLYKVHIEWILSQNTTDEKVRNMVATEFSNCIRFMKNEDLSGKNATFGSLSKTLDKIRNEDIGDIIPELKPLLQNNQPGGMNISSNFYFNNPWKPASHSFIKDEALRNKIDTEGYAVLKVLSDEALEQLKQLYGQTHQFVNGEGGMFYSLYSQDLNYRKKMHDDIGRILQPLLNDMLSGYKVMLNSFIVKASGPKSEFYVHQDTTGLDEYQYSPLSFWIPLHDITETNGAMCVMPRSHKLFSPLRSIAFPAPYDSIHASVRKYLIPLYPKAGEVVVFDNRIIHNSMPNLSGKERVVAISGIFPEQAALQTCWKDPAVTDSKIEIIEHKDDYLLTHPNFLVNCHERPTTGKTISFADDNFPPISGEGFDALCKANGIEQVNLLPDQTTSDCNMIAEPVTIAGPQAAAQPVDVPNKKNVFEKIKEFFN